MQRLNTSTIILGDFNSQVGPGLPEEHKNIGRYGLGIRNSQGWRLVRFCQENDLRLQNSYTKKRTRHRWSWMTSNGEFRSEIDFIVTENKGLAANIVHINTKFKYHSDHRIVEGYVIAQKNRTKSYKNKQIPIQHVPEERYTERLQKILSEAKIESQQYIRHTQQDRIRYPRSLLQNRESNQKN